MFKIIPVHLLHYRALIKKSFIFQNKSSPAFFFGENRTKIKYFSCCGDSSPVNVISFVGYFSPLKDFQKKLTKLTRTNKSIGRDGN